VVAAEEGVVVAVAVAVAVAAPADLEGTLPLAEARLEVATPRRSP
jgi:hypothetical protein